MIYELRIYHILPGRMDAINKRFADHTLGLFKKNGIDTVDFWMDTDEKSAIYYILEHKDRETRDANFEKFRNDPEWIEVKRLSELDGNIVEKVDSYFMKRVPYSPAAK